MPPNVTAVECIEFDYPVENMAATDDSVYYSSFPTYAPGESFDRSILAVRIETDTGTNGTYVSVDSPPGPAVAQIEIVAPYLVGRNPLHRERHWDHFRQTLWKYNDVGVGPIDVALWDIAGKHADVPIHELLGTHRTRFPAYASTDYASPPVDGDGTALDSPDSYADFAQECLEMGYPGFKIHGWRAGESGLDVERERATIHAVGERVGDRMDLMYDPVSQFQTFANAYKVGRACDEQDFLWIEDPYRNGDVSATGSRRFQRRVETPIAHDFVRGLEAHSNLAVEEATDFVRADPNLDGGITGVVKIARAAESLGVDVEQHICGPAQRHCLASIRNSNYYELGMAHPDHPVIHDPPIYEDGYSDGLAAVDDDGHVRVPDGPGLGVAYDWDYVYERSTNVVRFD